MLDMLPLLVSDPALPREVRDELAGSREQAVRALTDLGLDCDEAQDLAAVPDRERGCYCF